MTSTTKTAAELVQGDTVRRFGWDHSPYLSVIVAVKTRTLNDGKQIVGVDFGHGEGAAYYADEVVRTSL